MLIITRSASGLPASLTSLSLSQTPHGAAAGQPQPVSLPENERRVSAEPNRRFLLALLASLPLDLQQPREQQEGEGRPGGEEAPDGLLLV